MDDHDYQVPFKFTGKIEKLTMTVERPKLMPEDQKKTDAGTKECSTCGIGLPNHRGGSSLTEAQR
jgi:hypothetical protein